MYALVDINGKQYKAEKGTTLKIDRIPQEKGEKIEFHSVLLVSGSKNVKVGTPYVDGVTVKATVTEHSKDKKVVVFKYKKRKGYRRKYGHRQPYSLIKIDNISGVK